MKKGYACIPFSNASFYMYHENNKLSDDFYKNERRDKEHSVKCYGQTDFRFITGHSANEAGLNLVTKHQVSGLIHHLLGYIPVSYYDSMGLKPVESIAPMVDNTWVKLTSNCFYDISDKYCKCYFETQQYPSYNFNSKQIVSTVASNGEIFTGFEISWSIYRMSYAYFEDGKYRESSKEFLDYIKSLVDFDDEDHTEFIDVLIKIRDDGKYIEEVKNKALSCLNAPGYNMVCLVMSGGHTGGAKINFNFNAGRGSRMINSKLKTTRASISGELLVPCTTEEYKKMKIYTFGTFGDGGYAEVGKYIYADEDDLFFQGYSSINDNTEV